MSEMVEQVARTICRARGFDPDGSVQRHCKFQKPAWRAYTEDAVLVIQAMRDNLTDGMAEVIAMHGRCCGGVAHTIWVDACNEALK